MRLAAPGLSLAVSGVGPCGSVVAASRRTTETAEQEGRYKRQQARCESGRQKIATRVPHVRAPVKRTRSDLWPRHDGGGLYRRHCIGLVRRPTSGSGGDTSVQGFVWRRGGWYEPVSEIFSPTRTPVAAMLRHDGGTLMCVFLLRNCSLSTFLILWGGVAPGRNYLLGGQGAKTVSVSHRDAHAPDCI